MTTITRHISRRRSGLRSVMLRGTAALALLSAPAFAQQAEQQAQASKDSIEQIIVTAQQARKQVESAGSIGVLGNLDPLETPFNVSAYTAQLILDQQSETIGDVLENDPGVRTTFGSGNQSELFVIRGFALNGDDISINGLYGVTPRQLVSPELFDSVQVLAGASAFLYGAAPGGSGIGGGINLVPKRADKALFRVTASWNADSIFGGNFDAARRFGNDEQFGARVVGVYRTGEASIDDEDRKVAAAGLNLDHRTDRMRLFLDLGYEFQRADASRPIVRLAATTTVPLPPDSSYNFAQPWSFTRLRDLFALARAEFDINDDWMLYASGGFRDGREDGDYSTPTVTNGATGAATQSRLFVPRKDNNEAVQGGIRGEFGTGGVSHKLNAGASLVLVENRNSFTFGTFPAGIGIAPALTSFNTNIYNATITAKPTNSTLPSAGGSLTDLPKVSTGSFRSFFASDTIGFFDDDVQVTVGARQQNIVVSAWNRGTLLRTSRYDESATTPVVGVIYRPTETFSIYANRIEGLAQGPTAPVNANTTNPGEVFPPYKSTQYEAGAKLVIDRLTGTLAFYQTKQPSAFSRPVPGSATLSTFVIDGLQRNRGAELTLNGELSKQLRFIGGLTLSSAKQQRTLNGVNDGKRAVGVPKRQINFGVEAVPEFLSAATFTARVVSTSNQMVNIPNTQSIPGWTRLDLGLRYVVVADEHPVTFRLSAENVFDKDYWYSAFNSYLTVGTPRTLKASVTYEY